MTYCFVYVCFSELNTLNNVILFDTKVQLSAHINKKNTDFIKESANIYVILNYLPFLSTFLGHHYTCRYDKDGKDEKEKTIKTM